MCVGSRACAVSMGSMAFSCMSSRVGSRACAVCVFVCVIVTAVLYVLCGDCAVCVFACVLYRVWGLGVLNHMWGLGPNLLTCVPVPTCSHCVPLSCVPVPTCSQAYVAEGVCVLSQPADILSEPAHASMQLCVGVHMQMPAVTPPPPPLPSLALALEQTNGNCNGG